MTRRQQAKLNDALGAHVRHVFRIAVEHYAPDVRGGRRRSNDRVPTRAFDFVANKYYCVHSRVCEFPTPVTPAPSAVTADLASLAAMTSQASNSAAKQAVASLRAHVSELQRDLWAANAEIELLKKRCAELDRIPRWNIATASPVLRWEKIANAQAR